MKVLCVGKNYVRHAAEMGSAAPSQPIWFWKPESAIVGDGEVVVLPEGVGEVHHEVELAVRLGDTLHRAEPEAALRAVDGFTVAVDVTARDLQTRAKGAGHPWAQAKGYDTFLPLGAWQGVAGVDLQDLQLRLSIDGEVRQSGSTSSMTWPVQELLAIASHWTTLEAGDVLLTGTPEGVGPLRSGETMRAEVVDHVVLTNRVSNG